MTRAAKTPKAKIMVVVHPGSACGSADMTLGFDVADTARANLIEEISLWRSGVIVIDGVFSDELVRSKYRNLGQAITGALNQAQATGLIAHREKGDDNEPPHVDEAIRKVIRKFRLTPRNADISVTGCWTHPEDEKTGCVNGVRDDFRTYGFTAHIMPGSVSINAGE